jgi:hypothetical protein
MKRKLLQTSNIFLIAALTLISLVSPTGTGASNPQTDLVMPGATSATDPTPIYSVVWTATGIGSSDVTIDGNRSIIYRKLTMTGSEIVRHYADGSYDYSPFTETFTDEYDKMSTGPCIDYPGRSWQNHYMFRITDPNRYSGAEVTDGISLYEPIQRPDGSWYMLPPQGFDHLPFSYWNVVNGVRAMMDITHLRKIKLGG